MISRYMAGRADSNMISDALAGAAFASQTGTICRVSWRLTSRQPHTKYGFIKILGAIYGIFGMWRPLLTYGLLTLTITGLTLFNTMT